MLHNRWVSALAALLAASLSSCGDDSVPPAADSGERDLVYTEEREPCSAYSPLRNLYFGDLHAHTALSHDAWIFGVRATPDDAYGFARGEPLTLPPPDADAPGDRTIQLDRPLDFAALSEHSEFLGEVDACLTPSSGAYDCLTCSIFRQESFLSTIAISMALSFPAPERSPDICGSRGANCAELARGVWERVRKAAEDGYDRSSECSFTTFVAYEYTATTIAANLHRNVFFRNAQVPELPVSYFEAPTPWRLWAELESACLEGMAGCDVLVIPHNSNESNGNKFAVDYPEAGSTEEERRLARLRAQMEPLVEIFQNKGDSECMNGLSGVPGEPDELCDFEKLHEPPVEDCGEDTGFGGAMGVGCVSRLDSVRNVLLEGLLEEERLGVNPYKLGIIASTDTHNATPGAVAEDRYHGHLGKIEDTPQERLSPSGFGGNEGIRDNPGGLTAVWAVENSRDAIFEAFRRRETYATSGPRIEVRFFGGWDLRETMCDDPQDDPGFAKAGYEKGVPMGGDLPTRPSRAGAPRFAILAAREQASGGREGAPLQRLQIIKGWIDGGRPMLRIFDVPEDPPNGAGVDLESCERTGDGFDRLCAVWTDPDFNPLQRAFYYVRVIENPSCRWSTFDCNGLPPEARPSACSDPAMRRGIQERAWTSPIWFQP